jgi:hypothetical protein
LTELVNFANYWKIYKGFDKNVSYVAICRALNCVLLPILADYWPVLYFLMLTSMKWENRAAPEKEASHDLVALIYDIQRQPKGWATTSVCLY